MLNKIVFWIIYAILPALIGLVFGLGPQDLSFVYFAFLFFALIIWKVRYEMKRKRPDHF